MMINAGDISQYLYCPRKIYFMKVMGAKITRPKMAMGQEIHEKMYDNLKRRKKVWKGADEVLENVYLEGVRYGLKGYVDAIIRRGDEYIPVDFKFSRFELEEGGLFYNWKMQLVAYAVLVEENYNTIVKRVLIYSTESKKWIKVEISPEDRRALKRILENIKEIILGEKYPTIKKSRKCGYCEMDKICVD